MRSNEVKQRAKQFGRFGQFLLKRYRHNLAANQTGDPAAERLGRYLHAARVNAGLAPADVARQARVPLAVVLALETGLIPVPDIQAGWLRQLATALGEDVDDLELMLGPQRQKRRSLAWFKALTWPHSALPAVFQQKQPGRPLLPDIRPPLRSIYAAGLLTILVVCLAAVAVRPIRWGQSKPELLAEPLGRSGDLFRIEPAQRLALLTAESPQRNRVWTPAMRYLQFRSSPPLLVTGSDFDIKPPTGLSAPGSVSPPDSPERLNILLAERQLKIAALIQPAYAPLAIKASCCGVQP